MGGEGRGRGGGRGKGGKTRDDANSSRSRPSGVSSRGHGSKGKGSGGGGGDGGTELGGLVKQVLATDLADHKRLKAVANLRAYVLAPQNGSLVASKFSGIFATLQQLLGDRCQALRPDVAQLLGQLGALGDENVDRFFAWAFETLNSVSSGVTPPEVPGSLPPPPELPPVDALVLVCTAIEACLRDGDHHMLLGYAPAAISHGVGILETQGPLSVEAAVGILVAVAQRQRTLCCLAKWAVP